MKGSAEFCLAWLIEDGQGHLTTCPSFSTENDFMAPDGKPAMTSAGCTMDMALIRELFTNCIAASKELGVDAEFAAKLGCGARAAGSVSDRQIRTVAGMVDRLCGEHSGAAAYVALVSAISGWRDYAAWDSGAGEGGADFSRAAAGEWRRLYRLEPRVGDLFLGAAGRWRQGVGVARTC